MKMNISEFAKIAGVSVRTLHYYDEINLLKPDFVDIQNGYRFYGEKAFETMQEILFYRELDFSLKSIKEIISSPNYNKQEALSSQKHLLLLKKERLEKIIKTIETAEKGGKIMDLNAFSYSRIEAYKDEVKKRYGNTEAYKESQEKTANYTPDKWNEVASGLNEIISEFAEIMKLGVSETDKKAFALVEKLKRFITQTQYNCTNEILSFLGDMYVTDERFKKNIDKSGVGTAEFISKAIKAYCK